MKTHYTIAISVCAGVAIGAAAAQTLHAQAKPPAYVIAEIDVINPGPYDKEYVPPAAKAIADGLKKIRAIRQTLSGLYVADLALGDELVALSVINQASDLETSASSRQKSRRPGYAGLVGG